MNRTTRTLEVYAEVIDRMGMESRTQGNAILLQPVEGASFVITVDEGDPEFLRMAVAMGGEVPVSRLELLEICNAANRKLKSLKCTLDEDGEILFAVENLQAAPDCIPTVEHTLGIVPRLMHTMIAGIERVTNDLKFAVIADQASDGKSEEA